MDFADVPGSLLYYNIYWEQLETNVRSAEIEVLCRAPPTDVWPFANFLLAHVADI